ncbi:MAG: NUDIX hydrolase [Candidatus Moraniibacteriota bacterium]|nr:MAG: NUDIX hydrolase [Candidatus Moranbacteria bacterium]
MTTTISGDDPSLPHAVAGFFFCPGTGRVLLHQRDGQTTINPHKWAFFTGLVESDESPLAAFVREISEEIGYVLSSNLVEALDTYLNEERQTMRHVYCCRVKEEFLPEHVNEGAGVGWYLLSDAFHLDMTDLTRRDLEKFAARLDRVV